MDAKKNNEKREVMQWHNVIVLTSCCLIMVVDGGVIFSFGTLFTDLMATFNSSRAETSLVLSVSLSVIMLSGFIIGILVKEFGCVIIGSFGSVVFSFSLMACFFASSLIFVVIAVGVFSGFGLSCLYICTSDVINHHFSGEKRFLCMSMHGISFAIGGMIYPYLLRYLSDLYGWRGALLLVGAITLHTLPGYIIWKQRLGLKTESYHENNAARIAEFQKCMEVKTEVSDEVISIERLDQTETQIADLMFVEQFPVLKGETSIRSVTVRDVRKPSSDICNNDGVILNHIKSVLYNIPFMLIVFGTLLTMPSFNIIMIFAGDIYNDNGLTSDDLSFGLVLLSIFNILGRLCLGILLQSKIVPAMLVPVFGSIGSAVLFLIFTLFKTRSIVLALTALFGFPIGLFASMFTVLTLKLVGSNLLPIAVGIIFTMNGIGDLISGPIIGFIRDNTGTYFATFYFGMAAQFVAAFVFSLAHIIRRNRKNRRRHTNDFFLTNL